VPGLSGDGLQCHLDALVNRIRDRLKAKKFCTAFENDLDPVWPREKLSREKRYQLIQAFAAANQWEATINDPGIRVTFRQKQTANGAKLG
jgi:hypothetical protein